MRITIKLLFSFLLLSVGGGCPLCSIVILRERWWMEQHSLIFALSANYVVVGGISSVLSLRPVGRDDGGGDDDDESGEVGITESDVK